MAKGKKQPKFRKQPEARKEARSRMQQSIRGAPLSWRFSEHDKDGPFAWPALEDPAQYRSVLKCLYGLEQLSETDLRQQGSHPIPTHKLSKEAQERLSQLQHDDEDELFSFRIMGKPRVFCLIRGSVMYVLWWDPEHAVCPAQKRNT